MIGVLTDLISAATGVFVIPAVPYIGALNLDKEDMIQALGLSFTVATIALALALAADGRSRLATSALQPPRLRQRFSAWRRAAGGGFSEKTFRRIFFGGLLALGAHLASRAVM
jgi:hypothetical protein